MHILYDGDEAARCKDEHPAPCRPRLVPALLRIPLRTSRALQSGKRCAASSSDSSIPSKSHHYHYTLDEFYLGPPLLTSQGLIGNRIVRDGTFVRGFVSYVCLSTMSFLLLYASVYM